MVKIKIKEEMPYDENGTQYTDTVFHELKICDKNFRNVDLKVDLENEIYSIKTKSGELEIQFDSESIAESLIYQIEDLKRMIRKEKYGDNNSCIIDYPIID